MRLAAAAAQLEDSHQVPDRGRHVALDIGAQRLLEPSREIGVTQQPPQRVKVTRPVPLAFTKQIPRPPPERRSARRCQSAPRRVPAPRLADGRAERSPRGARARTPGPRLAPLELQPLHSPPQRGRRKLGLALGSESRRGEHAGADGGGLDAITAEATLLKRGGHQVQHAIA